ncbi:MAG: DUF2271 domain-containing protein [Kofleriaceae bacterium]|nr:DUF2271 domain-containing protein [Kofleriaceae bacterium]
MNGVCVPESPDAAIDASAGDADGSGCADSMLEPNDNIASPTMLHDEPGSLTASFTTTPVGAEWAPVNCVATWIEDEAGNHVKTISRWCQVRNQHLVAWQAKAGLNDVDGVSGASRPDHAATVTATWNLKDKLGNVQSDGEFRVRMETTDGNSTTQGQNWQGSFAFTKGTVTASLNPTDPGAHYANVNLAYAPNGLGTESVDGAICPAGDEDYFQINVTRAGTTIELSLTFEAPGATFNLRLLNAGGTAIAQRAGDTGALHVEAANLPVGTYYGLVSAQGTGTFDLAATVSVRSNAPETRAGRGTSMLDGARTSGDAQSPSS